MANASIQIPNVPTLVFILGSILHVVCFTREGSPHNVCTLLLVIHAEQFWCDSVERAATHLLSRVVFEAKKLTDDCVHV